MLLIDAGNTRIKAAFADNIDRNWAVGRDDSSTDVLIARLFDDCYRTPLRVVVSCVGDESAAEFLRLECLARWGVEAQRLVSADEFESVSNGYADPRELGIDRWAAIIAAWHQVQGAVVVVDCGTAVTVDTVAEDGCHLGGVIFPGLQLSAASFYQQTHNLPGVLRGVRDLYATSTAAAVSSGVRWAVTGGINAVLQELLAQLPPATPVLLTGGDAAELLPFLQVEAHRVDNLVFNGMALIAGFRQDG